MTSARLPIPFQCKPGFLAVLFCLALPWARAATLISHEVSGIVGDADVRNDGARVYAYNFSDSIGNTVTVNGVAFDGAIRASNNSRLQTAAGVLPLEAGRPSDLDSTYLGYNGGGSIGGAYGTLIGHGFYRSAGSNADSHLGVGNLTPGKTYVAQLWIHDARSLASARSADVFVYTGIGLTAGGDIAAGRTQLGSGSLGLLRYRTEAGNGQFFTVVFTLGPNENAASFFLDAHTKNHQQLNAFQLREIELTGPDIPAGAMYWDVNSSAAGSGNQGGIWDSGQVWTSSPEGTQATVAWQNGKVAAFSAGNDGGGDWQVYVLGQIDTPAIYFKETGNKEIANGTIQIGGGLIHTASVTGSSITTISSILAGNGGLQIQSHGGTGEGGGSAGHLRLRGVNTLSGDVTIRSGLVRSDSHFGAAGNTVVLQGGGLVDTGSNDNFTRKLRIPSGETGIYRTYSGATGATISGVLEGQGRLMHTDSGVLTLNADVSGFSGIIRNARGTLIIGENSANLAGVAIEQTDGQAKLRLGSAGVMKIKSLWSDQDVIIPAGARLDIVSGEFSTVDAGSSRDGFWVKGTIDNDPASAGEMTSSSGTLTLRDGQQDNGGTIEDIDHRVRVRLVDPAPGSPLAIVKERASHLIFDQPNTYSGGTVINGGRLYLQNPQALGSGAVVVNSGGQLWLDRDLAVENHITMRGLGAPEGSGILGAIRLSQGSAVAGQLTIADRARIAVWNAPMGMVSGSLHGSADLEVGVPGGQGNTVRFTGDGSDFTGTLVVNSPATANVRSLGGNLMVSGPGGHATVEGSVAGTSEVTGGLLQLAAGSNVGDIILSGGTLEIAPGAIVSGALATTLPSTMVLGGSVLGSLELAADDVLELDGGSVAGDIIFNRGAILAYNGSAPVAVGGTIFMHDETFVEFNHLPPVGEPATLFTYATGTTGNVENLTVENLSQFRSFSASNDVDKQRILVHIGSKPLIWRGNVSDSLDFDDANWRDEQGQSETFRQGDAITFDDSGQKQLVYLDEIVHPSALTFDNSSLNYELHQGYGAIVNGGKLTKMGTGTVLLEGADISLTGDMLVNEGTLRLGSPNILPVPGHGAMVRIEKPGTLEVGGTGNFVMNSLTGAGTLLNVGGARTMAIADDGSSFALETKLSDFGFGAMTLEKLGKGTLTLATPQDYSGRTIISGGTVSILDGGTIGHFSSNRLEIRKGKLTIDGGSVISNQTDNDVPLMGVTGEASLELSSGEITLTSTGTFTSLGNDRRGTWNQTGGEAMLQVNTLALSNWQGAGGSALNLSGGSFVVSNPDGRIAVGMRNEASVNISGTAQVVIPNIRFGWSTDVTPATASSELNLDGGSLAVGTIERNGAGSAIFNLNGGQLIALRDAPSLIGQVTRVNVRDGGARIDTDGFDATILRSLEHTNLDGDAAIDGGLVKGGMGTLTLAPGTVNDYTGDTLVAEGVLMVHGAITGGGAFTLSNGATLGGAGTIASPVTGNGKLAPGNGVGSLTVNGASVAGFYTCEVEGSGADKLLVNGDVDLSQMELEVLELGPVNFSRAVILSYTGTLTGAFYQLHMPSNYSVTYDTVAKQVVLERGGDYYAWARENNLTGGPDAVGTPGVANLLLYALDLDIQNPKLPLGSFDPVSGKLSFTKRPSAMQNGDLTYILESSVDLAEWKPVVIQDPGHADPEISAVLGRDGARKFWRLSVTTNAEKP